MKMLSLIIAFLLLTLSACNHSIQPEDSTPKNVWSLDKEGNILLSVTSDGTTGPEWISRLEKKGFMVDDYLRGILLSPDFETTNGITTRLVTIKGDAFTDKERTTKNIMTRAEEYGWQAPNAEVACLLRLTLSDEDIKKMGILYLVTMHYPIYAYDRPCLLALAHSDYGQSFYFYSLALYGNEWSNHGAFLFALP